MGVLDVVFNHILSSSLNTGFPFMTCCQSGKPVESFSQRNLIVVWDVQSFRYESSSSSTLPRAGDVSFKVNLLLKSIWTCWGSHNHHVFRALCTVKFIRKCSITISYYSDARMFLNPLKFSNTWPETWSDPHQTYCGQMEEIQHHCYSPQEWSSNKSHFRGKVFNIQGEKKSKQNLKK